MRNKPILDADKIHEIIDALDVPLKQSYEVGKSMGMKKHDVHVMRKLFGISGDSTTKNRCTGEEHNEWIRLYREGLSCAEIARQYNMSTGAVYSFLKNKNVYVNPKSWSMRQVAGLKNLLYKGLAVKDIAPIIGKSESAIFACMNRKKLFRYNKQKRKKKDEA